MADRFAELEELIQQREKDCIAVLDLLYEHGAGAAGPIRKYFDFNLYKCCRCYKWQNLAAFGRKHKPKFYRRLICKACAKEHRKTKEYRKPKSYVVLYGGIALGYIAARTSAEAGDLFFRKRSGYDRKKQTYEGLPVEFKCIR